MATLNNYPELESYITEAIEATGVALAAEYNFEKITDAVATYNDTDGTYTVTDDHDEFWKAVEEAEYREFDLIFSDEINEQDNGEVIGTMQVVNPEGDVIDTVEYRTENPEEWEPEIYREVLEFNGWTAVALGSEFPQVHRKEA